MEYLYYYTNYKLPNAAMSTNLWIFIIFCTYQQKKHIKKAHYMRFL